MTEKDEALEAQLERILLERIAEDKLTLPTMPAAAIRCLEILRDPNVPLKVVGAAIENDPLLAAQVLRLANSAAHGSRGSTSIDQALPRLGVQRIKSFLVEASARRLFQSRDSGIHQACLGMWEHSRAVAVLARDIAAIVGDADAETVYVAGLLHDVGKPLLAAIMLEAERMLTNRGSIWINSIAWVAAIHRRHRTVATALAEKWKLPDVVTAAVRDSAEFNPAERSSPANFVCFANALVKIHGIHEGQFDTDDAQALVMVGRSLLGVQDDVVARLTAGLRDRVRVDFE